jgi:hypothetical protein
VRILGALEARYADDHVPLAMVLGAMSALTAVRRLLPAEPHHRRAPPGVRLEPDPFITLLLGVIATHDRLLRLVGPALASHGSDRQAHRADPVPSLEGLLR